MAANFEDPCVQLYWKKFDKTRFCQKYSNSFNEKMPIPERFVQKMEQILPNKVKISHAGLSSVEISIINNNNVFYFAGQWKEFVKQHSLEESDSLFFEYNKGDTFERANTKCEKEASYFAGHILNAHPKAPMDEPNTPLNDINFKQATKKQKKTKQSLLTKKEKNANTALEPQAFEEDQTEQLVTIMRPSYISEAFSLTLKSDWACKNMPNRDQQVVLQAEEKQWNVNFQIKDKQRFIFAGGWRKFVVDNNLETSDTCIFHIAATDTSKMNLKVDIVRNSVL